MKLLVSGTLANLLDGTSALNQEGGIATITASGTTAVYKVVGRSNTLVTWKLAGINKEGTGAIGDSIWRTGWAATTKFPKLVEITV